MISAGRVLIKPCGEWNAETTYHMLDLVNHNGYAWLAKRTVVGIEPSKDYPDYWHNMLDMEKIVAEAMAGTLAEEVSELLKDELSKARYVEDLLAEVDVPTFVYWNDETLNTPYSEGYTDVTHGYALVEGNSLTAWADGETFTYSANGWDKVITSSGGTMTGELKLGGGKGAVSADEDGAYLEAKNGDDFKQIKVKNDSLEESAKLVTKDKEFNLFGEHNPDKIAEHGYAKTQFITYIGNGKDGNELRRSYTFGFKPEMIHWNGEWRYWEEVEDGPYYVGNSTRGHLYISGNTISWYHNGGASENLNKADKVYNIFAIG